MSLPFPALFACALIMTTQRKLLRNKRPVLNAVLLDDLKQAVIFLYNKWLTNSVHPLRPYIIHLIVLYQKYIPLGG